MTQCTVCGGNEFEDHEVLWDALCAEWQISPDEKSYINRQQGTLCTGCRSNKRSTVLASAIMDVFGEKDMLLKDWVAHPRIKSLRVLEVNEAGSLTNFLKLIPDHIAANYPEYDIHCLPFPESTFDLVVHSDTLEHVEHPVTALAECRRVLKHGGVLAFTVPTIVGRLTRSRAGLPESFHGDPNTSSNDYRVVTEYGADMWTQVIGAGFDAVKIHAIEFPVALAITAVKSKQNVYNVGNNNVSRQLPEDIDVGEAVISQYDQDGLLTYHNHEFMRQPAFVRAYQRGVKSAGADYKWHWRVHVGLWAAAAAAPLEGDYVECGVNRGFLASAIMDYLDWNRQGREFYLLDTFEGIDMKYVTQEEVDNGIVERNKAEIDRNFYATDVSTVRKNFSEWQNVTIIQGSIPTTLQEIGSNKIAFLSIDMNCTMPEVAAIEYLWDKLVPGAMIVLDDYAYSGYRLQKVGMDGFARSRGVKILSLPTGQGLLVKPPTYTKPR